MKSVGRLTRKQEVITRLTTQNVQTERNGAEYFYDGYDRNRQNVAVQIKDQPIYTDDNDTYWNFNNDSGATNPPPP